MRNKRFFISCNNNETAKTADNAMVERGKYMANNVLDCIDCHSQRDYTKFSGLVTPGTEGMGGEVFN